MKACWRKAEAQADLQSCGKEAYEELKKVTEFFGESYDAMDPSRILRIVRDFMRLFDKSTKEIQVCGGCVMRGQKLVGNVLGFATLWQSEAATTDWNLDGHKH